MHASDNSMAPKARLIFALDVEDAAEADRWIQVLAPHVGVFKVGPRLFARTGPSIIERIHDAGAKTFLDLKLHDIPETVGITSREIARLGVEMFTLHALGGGRMIRRVADEVRALGSREADSGSDDIHRDALPRHGLAPRPIILAVTILTSHSPSDLVELGIEASLDQQVLRLARLAVAHGASGLVASGHEVARLKAELPVGTVFVVPGIRSPGDDLGDQARVMTPGEAVRAGATYIVVGRPLRQAPDPVAAARRIVEDVAGAIE
ncbi:MAG: orotidine-5'-phosphate decarboxylase [Deltaproteobacteria bacterium]|nr:orotidine-5'-phosphate decarboxylase [Deltaproteobacteria bacterium]